MKEVLAAIEKAKAAVNHAQVVLAAHRNVPADITVDEGDRSYEAKSMREAYYWLCQAEINCAAKDKRNV